MIAALTRVSRARYMTRPLPPYAVNWGSWQAQGLVAFWPMGEGSGAACLDYGTRLGGLRMTQTGTMTIGAGPGETGYALANTGSTANYLISSVAAITAAPFTMATWVNPATATTGYNLMVINTNNNGVNYFNLTLSNTTSGRLDAGASSATENDATTTAAFTAGVWGHACGVYTSATARAAFWNGGAKGTNAASVTPAGLNQTLLAAFRDQTMAVFSPLNGRICHACIWNRALSDTEVAMLYDPQWRWDLYYPLGRRYMSFAPVAAAADETPQQNSYVRGQAVPRASML